MFPFIQLEPQGQTRRTYRYALTNFSLPTPEGSDEIAGGRTPGSGVRRASDPERGRMLSDGEPNDSTLENTDVARGSRPILLAPKL